MIADPSHAAGKASLVEPLAYSSISAGADGLMIEVKPSENYAPEVDAEQAITLPRLKRIVETSKRLTEVL